MEHKPQIVKESFDEVRKELEKEKTDELKKNIKEAIRQTLLKLEEKQNERRRIVKEIQILKMDIKDFKAGRLDRIEERQNKDKVAKEISMVQLEKITDSNRPWSQNFNVAVADSAMKFTASGFDFYTNTAGTYTLDATSGDTRYL